MNIDLILETISDVSVNTKYPLEDRCLLLSHLMKLIQNSQVPDLGDNDEH